MATTIKATKTLINGGQCFTKGDTYTVDGYHNISSNLDLMGVTVTNDLGEPHRIGLWYKHFIIVR